MSAQLLAYPNFDKHFILEIDASKLGLEATLSQTQDDNRLHPVAHASRSVSTSEANYAISDLETLAIVWAVTHFHYYLYRHNVTVVTDHAAVKVILGSPNLTGRHARWCSKVYDSGIQHLEIVHHSGKNSLNVDCLSRQPDMPAPQDDDGEVQIALVSSQLPDTIEATLEQEPMATHAHKW